MKIKQHGKRNIDKYDKSVLKVGGKSIKIHKNKYAKLQELKARANIRFFKSF